MKHKGIFFITLILMVFSFSVMVSAKVSLSALFMKQAGYQESDMIAMTDEFLKQNPDVEVNLNFVSYEELHDKIAVAAASESGVYDVIISDCVWPAEFAEAGWIIDVTDRLKDEDRADIFPTVLNSVTYKDRIYGMPWLNDWQYFFYNKKMLNEVGASVPTLWPEVIETSPVGGKAGRKPFPTHCPGLCQSCCSKMDHFPPPPVVDFVDRL
jgi:multiple sugar transport system substrate-binding protein